MQDQSQQNDASQQPHDNRLLDERVRTDSVYLAALKKTALAAAISAVGFTVVAYLLFTNILDRKPKLANHEISDYGVFSGDVAVVFGLAIALGIWLISARICRRYTLASRANRRNYSLLFEKFDRLRTRIRVVEQIDGQGGYGQQEWSEDPGSVILRAMRQQALEQARHECEEIGKGLRGRGMPWGTGMGYIELWHRVHRAEEALIKVEPYPEALEGAMRDESRLSHSTIANKEVLLKRLRCAVAMLDDSTKTCKELNYLEQPAPQECSLPSAKERTLPINRAKALAMLGDVRYEINSFRDNVWEGLVIRQHRYAG